MKEAQKATAQFDLWLRDSYSTVLDRTVPVPYRPPEVANASGAEGTALNFELQAIRACDIPVFP